MLVTVIAVWVESFIAKRNGNSGTNPTETHPNFFVTFCAFFEDRNGKEGGKGRIGSLCSECGGSPLATSRGCRIIKISSEKGLEDDQGKEVKGEGLTGCCYRGGAFLYLS